MDASCGKKLETRLGIAFCRVVFLQMNLRGQRKKEKDLRKQKNLEHMK
jgi:hypothetical protein